MSSGAIFFIVIVALLLASAAAWIVAGLYRRRMLELMRAGHAPALGATPGENVPDRSTSAAALGTPPASAPSDAQATRWGTGIDLAANRRAAFRLMLALGGLSLLVALTQSALALLFIYRGSFSIDRLVVLTAVYAWPMVLAWGLAWRWSLVRIAFGVALYMLGMLALVMLRSSAAQDFASVAGWLFSQVAVPLSITFLFSASGRIRAVAPYLLAPAVLLSAGSVLSLEIVARGVQDLAPWLAELTRSLGAYPTLLLFIFAPWLILAWPVFALSRWLAGAYRAKRFSDLGYLVAVYWFVILFSSAITALGSAGSVAFTQLLPWLWLPALACALRGALRPPEAPATLLVLRVFQRDAEVELLFDRVVERWRLTGNTVLIAGTDLLSRTLDPDDLFVYLDGRLTERFIADAAQFGARLETFDWRPDPDGRYRINECYCYDGTWRAVLRVLVDHSALVLIDLRGFSASNAGCRHELSVLGAAAHLRRIVVLHDAQTARTVAEADIGAQSARFHWIAAERLDSKVADHVLAALFGD